MKNFKKIVSKPFLFVGLGLAIATIAFAGQYDPPGKPGTPCIIDFDVDFCDLEYTAPKSDGGSPINGYLIQVRDKYSFFWDNKGTSTTLRYTARGLQEGSTYEFRVQAENKAGFGDPSDASDYFTARPR